MFRLWRLSAIALHIPKRSASNMPLNITGKTPPINSTISPLAGAFKPYVLKGLYYGPSSVSTYLLSCLPSESSKAFIITGSSLATKTPLIKHVEELLTPVHHAGTFSSIKQHAPVAQLDEATDIVVKDASIDTIISIGGGSPIDSAKAISYRLHEKTGSFLRHISIPTTLSAAECTANAGYTGADGLKTSVNSPEIIPSYILYDPTFGRHTPPHLFLSTALRALDHAVELQYNQTATEMPCKLMALSSAQQLFEFLPKYKNDPNDEDVITRLFLAAYGSLGFLGQNIKGGLGLSHTLGYALGSPYGIPHGVTSCMTLGHVVQLKAKTDPNAAASIARLLPMIGGKRSGDDVQDAVQVGKRILQLVDELDLKTTLTEKGVGKDQLDVIVQRAIGGQKDGNVYDAVRKLVEGLY
jgi:alcohol dehydrogenase class IV